MPEEKKRKTTTSTDVKRRYNEKTYTRWFADLHIEVYSEIEALRGEQSRAQFLKELIEVYKKTKNAIKD
jgi:hypothetical protein